MQKLIEKLIATNFADLEGLQITGTIPVKQELLNEAIADTLAEGLPTSSGAGAPAASSASSRPSLDINGLLKLVKRAEVTAHEGEIRLEFEIRR